MLAALTGVKGSVMMLAHGSMHVSHVSTHVALEDVPERLTPERLRLVIDLTHRALRDLGVARARIAVAALNPHAGEGGLFGRQDIDISEPTIAQAVADGMDVVGPVPGDTVFVKLRAEQYDAVIAMYHDQGLIPVKTLAFEQSVNVTLGLPYLRVSVDHGTAFDIAGKGVADAAPGDTVFVKLHAGQYDAVIAMYHDQGHIPVKLLGFNVDPATGRWEALSGVNITLGLPIIRTSVDHGTAFDIAGTGKAQSVNMVVAIDLAAGMGRARRAARRS